MYFREVHFTKPSKIWKSPSFESISIERNNSKLDLNNHFYITMCDYFMTNKVQIQSLNLELFQNIYNHPNRLVETHEKVYYEGDV